MVMVVVVERGEGRGAKVSASSTAKEVAGCRRDKRDRGKWREGEGEAKVARGEWSVKTLAKG